MRDLGSMGESTFCLWCNSVGLVANRSRIDKTGWDFYIEFPIKKDPDLPMDLIRAPIECRVQVKATDGAKGKQPITVSNLTRLIKAQMPTFFCFIEFDGKDNAQRSFLVHVGKEIIEKTLKRIRELEEKGDGKILHKRKILIHYGKEERLKLPDGIYLKQKIEYYIPSGIEKYVQKKNELLNTLGFEEGKVQLNLTVSGEHKIKDMIDISLGINKKAEIDRFVGRHSRFGIVSKEPFCDYKDGKLAIGIEPFSKAIVTFKEYEFSPGISFNANLYNSPFNSYLPQNYKKFRVEGKFFDLIFEPYNKSGKYNFSLNGQIKITLRELRDILKILAILKASSDGIHLSIKPDGLPPLEAKISVSDEIDDWSVAYKIAEKAICICQKVSIHENNIIANLSSLLDYSDSIERFYSIIHKEKCWMKTEFTIDEDDFVNSKKTACVFLISTIIGDHIIGCYVGIIGCLELLGEKHYQMVSSEFILGRPLVNRNSEKAEQKILDNEFKIFETSLENEGLEIVRIMS